MSTAPPPVQSPRAPLGTPAAGPLPLAQARSSDITPEIIATSDGERWLAVYFLFGTLLVYFILGGFWIWHFAR